MKESDVVSRKGLCFAKVVDQSMFPQSLQTRFQLPLHLVAGGWGTGEGGGGTGVHRRGLVEEGPVVHGGQGGM